MDTKKSMESLRDRDLFFRMLLKIQLFLVDRDDACPCCEMGFTGMPHKDDCEFALLVRSAIKRYGEDCGLIDCVMDSDF